MKKFFFLIFIILSLISTYSMSSSADSRVINLTALGDSITYGSGDPSKKGYIGRVEMEIEEKTDIPADVNNFGIPKYTAENILEQLKDNEIKRGIIEADYIILYIGTNDFRKSADYNFKQLDVKKISEGRLKFSANLRKIVARIRKYSNAHIIVLGLYHPYVEYKNQLKIRKQIEQWNLEIVDVINDFDQTWYVPTIDLFQDKPKAKYFSDSLHPNSAGYKQISNRVLQKVIILEKRM